METFLVVFVFAGIVFEAVILEWEGIWQFVQALLMILLWVAGSVLLG
ncbi:MAG: hypothetical protein PHI12_09705 [Dehalococcoidales bacterium]|nr:hypothetical protein [Dehalococcoidales bacterium]